jgi:hypothetical protein
VADRFMTPQQAENGGVTGKLLERNGGQYYRPVWGDSAALGSVSTGGERFRTLQQAENQGLVRRYVDKTTHHELEHTLT